MTQETKKNKFKALKFAMAGATLATAVASVGILGYAVKNVQDSERLMQHVEEHRATMPNKRNEAYTNLEVKIEEPVSEFIIEGGQKYSMKNGEKTLLENGQRYLTEDGKYVIEDGNWVRLIEEPFRIKDKNIRNIRPAQKRITGGFIRDSIEQLAELDSLEGKIVKIEGKNVNYVGVECKYQVLTVNSGDKNYTLVMPQNQKVQMTQAKIEFEPTKEGLISSGYLIANSSGSNADISVKADGLVRRIIYEGEKDIVENSTEKRNIAPARGTGSYPHGTRSTPSMSRGR